MPFISERRPALFLDRDGTIMVEVDHCCRPEDVALVPGAREAMATARAAGYWLIVITNQSGIGRGYFTEADYRRVEARLAQLLGEAAPDATYFCPDLPSKPTPRRKPGVGMIEEATAAFSIDLGQSWMIGDKPADIACGRNAGVRTVLVETGYGRKSAASCSPDYRVDALPTAIAQVLKKSAASLHG